MGVIEKWPHTPTERLDKLYATYVKLCDRLANAQYSKDTNSKMLEVYQKENIDFFNGLFPNNNLFMYRGIISEINDTLGLT